MNDLCDPVQPPLVASWLEQEYLSRDRIPCGHGEISASTILLCIMTSPPSVTSQQSFER